MEILIHPAGWNGGQQGDGRTLFTGLARARGRRSGCRTTLPADRKGLRDRSLDGFELDPPPARHRQPGALPMGGKRPFSLTQHRDWVLARVAEKPDITLAELNAELKDRGLKVSVFAIWHFLRRQGVSFKNVWPAPLQAASSIRPRQSASTCTARRLAAAKMEIRAFRFLLKTSA